jgi:hypothetical protein
VTVVFSDVTGPASVNASTRVCGRDVRYFGVASGAGRAAGPSKFIGDAIMAVFGVPDVHEDDALPRARAAVELQGPSARSASERAGSAPPDQTGVNEWGRGVGDLAGQAFVSGDAVNVAARLGRPHSPARSDRCRDRGWYGMPSVSNRSTPREGKASRSAFPWSSLAARRRSPTLDSPMLGRDAELGQVLDAFDEPNGAGMRLVTVSASRGGKSRLVRRLSPARPTGADVGRCLPYQGITFWPIGDCEAGPGSTRPTSRSGPGSRSARCSLPRSGTPR